MIARPARVRIRSRKPWVFARRRLLGWNVRLLTSELQGHQCRVGEMGPESRSPRDPDTSHHRTPAL